jgi:acetyl-CoA carboxylase biotin carboxyl carrier protein
LKFEDISKLADLVKMSGLSEIEVEEDGFRLRISNGEVLPPRRDVPLTPTHPIYAHDYIVPAAIDGANAHGIPKAKDDDNFHIIRSPMVGTFYGSPSPDAQNYVEYGTEVDANTIVCIIEAMKVMNEIQADVRGTIVEVLATSGQSVEYSQPLFRVKKSQP